jgi:hypothetical protein
MLPDDPFLKEIRMRLSTFALLAALLPPLPLVADTYTYTYTGNDFSAGNVSLPYTASDFVTVTFTLSAPLGDNLTYNYGSGSGTGIVTPLTWSFSDGVQTDTSADPVGCNGCAYPIDIAFDFVTNGSGQIVNWQAYDYFGDEGANSIGTLFIASYNQDGATILREDGDGSATGDEVRNPGVWSVTESGSSSVTPESPSFVLVLLGGGCLCGAGALRSRRRLRALTV